jgi:hypothetical protein
MTRMNGSAALRLDFGDVAVTACGGRSGRGLLRLASSRLMRGPDKYKVLEHRRRQAQIRARHLLHLMEGEL